MIIDLADPYTYQLFLALSWSLLCIITAATFIFVLASFRPVTLKGFFRAVVWSFCTGSLSLLLLIAVIAGFNTIVEYL